jgi:fluoroquinolone transport system ATP-binding protein
MIQVKDVSFSYGVKPFIEDINFKVGKGEIFGFLGPSGAGKSTLQKILTGLLLNYEGSVMVNNTEVRNHDNSFYENIGVDFEFSSLYEKLTAVENLKFFGSLYSKPLVPVDELLNMVGLLQDGNKKVSEYSKGMKSRLNFIKALIHRPDVIFLDEPTSGLDPSNSRQMKDIILDLKKQGKTIIITTHNMHDAAELCDQVAFIIDGKIKALDPPQKLMLSKGGTRITYSYMENGELRGSETLRPQRDRTDC